MIIHKTHSKNDLIDLINTLNLKIVFSHVDIKKNIHDKFYELLNDKTLQKPFISENVYHIKNYGDLKNYLRKPNPKKYLSVKEKNDIMKICKHIINYCVSGYDLQYSYKYSSIKEIQDDMDYIKQFGDIPSVRRCCKLMNKNLTAENHYIPIVSPQVQKQLNDKLLTKKQVPNSLKVHTGNFVLTFS
tara:strand:+ start:86 stop:646 length:561 start_codon:yes stop_codon:yes gene_type:complete